MTQRVEIADTRGSGTYDVFHYGMLLVQSRTPLLSAARKFLEAGYDPAERIEMARLGSTQVDLSSTIGAAAEWSVSEEPTTRFVPFVPFPAATMPRAL